MSKITTDYFCILNNDTEVCKNWDKNLINPLKENEDIIASGPLTTENTSHQDILRMSDKLKPLRNIKHVLVKNQKHRN